MTPLQTALTEIKRTQDHESHEMKFRLLEGKYVEFDTAGWLILTAKGEAELTKAEAVRVKRNAASKKRNASLRDQGLKRTSEGWT